MVAETEILFHRHHGNKGMAMPVFRYQCDSATHRVIRRVDVCFLPANVDSAIRPPVGTKDRPNEFGPAGAYQPGQTQDLALPNLEIDLADDIPGQIFGAQNNLRLGDIPAHPAMTRFRRKGTASDQVIELVRCEFPRCAPRNKATVAQNGYPVGNLLNFRHAMRDVHYPLSRSLQLPDQIEQTVALVRRKA